MAYVFLARGEDFIRDLACQTIGILFVLMNALRTLEFALAPEQGLGDASGFIVHGDRLTHQD
jgi:hypothetical protein